MRYNYEELGKRIRKIRKEQGMSQEEFAELLGTQQYFISKLENGKVDHMSMIELVAQTLGIELKELLFGTEDKE